MWMERAPLPLILGALLAVSATANVVQYTSTSARSEPSTYEATAADFNGKVSDDGETPKDELSDVSKPRPVDPANVETEEALASCLESLSQQDTMNSKRAYNFTQRDLLEFAENCEYRIDIPGKVSDERAAEVEMSEQDKEAYDRALARFETWKEAEIRGLLREARSDMAIADDLKGWLSQLPSADGDDINIQKKISRERAGLPVDDGSSKPKSLYWQGRELQAKFGDRFQDELSKEIGEERAAHLRAALDGWPGGRVRAFNCGEGTRP